MEWPRNPVASFLVSVFGSRPSYPHRHGCFVTREWHYLGELGDVDFWGEVYHWGWVSEAQMRPRDTLSSCCLRIWMQNSVTSPAPWVPLRAMLSDMMTKDQISEPVSKSQLNSSF